MDHWHRSQEHPRSHKIAQRTPSPSPTRSGDSTPPLLLAELPRSPVDALEMDSLNAKITALETSPRKSSSPRKQVTALPCVSAPSFSEPLSLLAQSLITLQNSRTAPTVTSSLAARHSVRFALEGVLDVALGMSGASLTAEEVLKECFAEMGLQTERREGNGEAPKQEEVGAERPLPPSSPTTDERLAALEQSTIASQAAILDRLSKVEKQLKKQSKRSTQVEGEGRPEEKGSKCDCESQKVEMERVSRQRRDSVDVEMQQREKDILSKVLPLVKQHRDDLKAATSVAGDRFRKQALAQVQASLRLHRQTSKRAAEEAEDFLDWYCSTFGFDSPVIAPPSSVNDKGLYYLSVAGRRVGCGKSPDSSRTDALSYLQSVDKELSRAWTAHRNAEAEEQELEVIQEVSSVLKREKAAYEARLISLGWRLEEDAQGLLYRSMKA